MSSRLDVGAALAPLRSIAFRRYLVGQLPSVTCSWAQVVALSWVVVHLDPRALGWVVAAQFLPSLAFGPWFGAVVDRHDRRRLLILAEAGLALVALGYAAASTAGALALPLIYALGSAWGVINALDTPARRTLVPMLVPSKVAASASALHGTVLVLGMAAGTALGAILVTVAGAAVTFAVNAASFLVDVVILTSIRVGASPRVRRAPRQIRDGIVYVWRAPPLRAAMITLAIIATFAFTVQVSVPTLAEVGFDGGPARIGAFFTAVTGGGLAGTLVFAARTGPKRRSFPRISLAIAAALFLTALSPYAWVAILGLAGVGFTWAYLLGNVLAILQTSDPRLMGRVMSLFALVLLGGTTVGGPLAAALAGVAGCRAPFFIGAGSAVIAAWLAPSSPRVTAVVLAGQATTFGPSGNAAPGREL
jgi:MFS family permease